MSDAAVDFQLLFDKAAEWQRDSGQQTPQLQWCRYNISRIRVQHESSYSLEPRVHAMLQAMAASQKAPRTIRPPAGAFPLLVTGAIARMQSPAILQLPCVGRYTPDNLSLHAAAVVQQQQGDDSIGDGELTMVELSIEAVKQRQSGSEQQPSRDASWKGHYRIKEFSVGSGREKGPLRLMHVFQLSMRGTVDEAGRG